MKDGVLKYRNTVADPIFRIARGQLVSSIPLGFNWTDENEPIAKVLLGSRNKTHLKDIQMFLHSRGITKAPVEKSDSSYSG